MKLSNATLLAPASRRRLLAAATLAAAGVADMAVPRGVWAAEPERKSVTIAVGGQYLLYYLPMALAGWLNFYREEGLDVRVLDTSGGTKSRQAVLGGAADIVSGAFEHTVRLQVRGLRMRAFVLQGRTPQGILALNRKTMGDTKDVSKLRGRTIGVTGSGSSTHVFANFVMQRAGIPQDAYFITAVGAGRGAIEAVRSGKVDAIASVDPIIGFLDKEKAITVVVDSSDVAQSDLLYGGPMVGGCLYAPEFFMERNPETVQRLTNAVVRALRVLAAIPTEELVKVVPPAALLGDPALYGHCFRFVRPVLSADGRIPEGSPATAIRALIEGRPDLRDFRFDEAACFTNRFVDASPRGA